MKGQPGLRVKEIAFVRLRRTAITFFSSLPVGRQAKKVIKKPSLPVFQLKNYTSFHLK
jgi:hypothetical protein